MTAFEKTDDFVLVIAPEGTCSHQPYWRSGFYEIARATGMPVVLAALDGGRREVRIGPTIEPHRQVSVSTWTGSRRFYADVRGIKHERAGVVRLRTEKTS